MTSSGKIVMEQEGWVHPCGLLREDLQQVRSLKVKVMGLGAPTLGVGKPAQLLP